MNDIAKKEEVSGKIESKEDAIIVIKNVSNVILVIAVVAIGAGLLIEMLYIIDGIALAISAFLLRKFKSRIIAVLLLLYSLASAVFTGLSIIGYGEGGTNIWLAFLLAYASFGAVQATFKYKKLK